MLRKSYILYSKVALLVIGVGIVIAIAVCSSNLGYEAENRVGNWVLNVRVTPADITVGDNITMEVTIKYLGYNRFRATAPHPFGPGITIIRPDGTVYEATYFLGMVSEVDVYPQFYRSRQFVFGPLPDPGTYRIEVSHLVYNPDSSGVDLTVALSIEVKP